MHGRCEERCLSCHNPTGTASQFANAAVHSTSIMSSNVTRLYCADAPLRLRKIIMLIVNIFLFSPCQVP